MKQTTYILILLISFISCKKEMNEEYIDVVNTNFSDNLLSSGLKAFRKPGIIDEKAACANCHAPDGFDLAYFNFSDEDIFRVAMPHLENEEEAQSIVDMVKELRKKNNIIPKDPLTFRPFQPAGYVLSGNTPMERDLNFGRQLVNLGYRFANIPVTSLEEAKKQRDEINSINIKTLPIGIPFNLWSEDPHHGEEHRSVAEWIPFTPSLVKEGKEEEWLSIQDIYLSNPTDDNFLTMYDKAHELLKVTNEESQTNRTPHFNKLKYLSVLIAQHFFREEILSGKSFENRPSVAFYPLRGDWSNSQRRTYSPSAVWDIGTMGFRKAHVMEIPEVEMKKNQTVKEELKNISAQWFYNGWMFESTLQRTDQSNSTKNAEYFTRSLQWHEQENDNPSYAIHAWFAGIKKTIDQNYDSVINIVEENSKWYESYPRFTMGTISGYGNDWNNRPKESEREKLYLKFFENGYRMQLFLVEEQLKNNTAPISSGIMNHYKSMIEYTKLFFSNYSDSEMYEFNMGLVSRVEMLLFQ